MIKKAPKHSCWTGIWGALQGPEQFWCPQSLHTSLPHWARGCLVRLLFPFLRLFVSINKYKYSISRCRCPWKLGSLGMFLLKLLLTGKLGFDKSVFLPLLLINRACFMLRALGFLFFHWKTKQACMVCFSNAWSSARAGFRRTSASCGALRRISRWMHKERPKPLIQSLTQAKGQGGTTTHFWGAESAATQDSFLGV